MRTGAEVADYYRRRASAQASIAARATSPVARRLHEQLVALYVAQAAAVVAAED